MPRRTHSPALILTGLIVAACCAAAGFWFLRQYAEDRDRAKLNRITTAISRGEYDAARGLISAALVDEKNPRMVSELFLQRASLRVYAKEPDSLVEATKDAGQAVNADPSNPYARRTHAAYSQMLGERFHELTPKEAAPFFKTAADDYTAVINQGAADYRDWLGRAKAYKFLGDAKKAEEDCKQAVGMDPAAKAEARAVLPGKF